LVYIVIVIIVFLGYRVYMKRKRTAVVLRPQNMNVDRIPRIVTGRNPEKTIVNVEMKALRVPIINPCSETDPLLFPSCPILGCHNSSYNIIITKLNEANYHCRHCDHNFRRSVKVE
jgi:hypothetical protein